MIQVRPVTSSDTDSWLRMRCDLWPEGSESEHRTEIERFFAGQVREPLEGSQGCTEFASDALVDNHVSAAAHRALGLQETVQIRCFRKVIDPLGR
jgi:hypothetical protein